MDIPASELTFTVATGPGVREFIATHHYSKTCPPGKYAPDHPVLVQGDEGMLFRKPSLPKTGKAYGVGLELSRLVLLDEAGRNSESRFIGWTLRWLRKNTKERAVISFADPRFGHAGTVYRASNWEYLGHECGHGTRRIVGDGVEMHSKTAYDRWGASGAFLIALLAPRKVSVLVCPPKHVYRYVLR